MVIGSLANLFQTERPWWQLTPYITSEMAVNLKNHKYSGSDEGFAYIYFYNPVANKLVSYLPETLAPNTITLIGFCHTLTPMIIQFTVIGAQMFGPVPSWFCYLQAWCYFWYRMLDEMDGKQARRTQNSSPLGLIFDHGCDAFSTGIQSIIFMRILQVGNNALCFYVMITVYAAFHFATLEEYYVGTLRLPPLNAVSDGSVLAIGLFIFSGVKGNEVWATPVCDGSWLHIKGI